MQLLTAHEHIAGMKVAVQAYLSNAASAFVTGFNAIEHELGDSLVSLNVLVGNEIVVEQIFDGLGAVTVNVDAGPMLGTEPRTA